jgi:hypothetical protein
VCDRLHLSFLDGTDNSARKGAQDVMVRGMVYKCDGQTRQDCIVQSDTHVGHDNLWYAFTRLRRFGDSELRRYREGDSARDFYLPSHVTHPWELLAC